MSHPLNELDTISEQVAENSEAALQQLLDFKSRHARTKNRYILARADLLRLTAASICNKYEQQQIDDQQLLKYFEKEKKYDEAAQLLLAKARHCFMNSRLAEGETLLQYLHQHFWGKISLRSEIVYYTRITFVYMRQRQYDEMLKVSMVALEKLNAVEEKTTWHYSIYTIFCTNIAEAYHTNSDFEKAWPYLQQSLQIADNHNIPTYNKYNVYSYVAYFYEYQEKCLEAARWFEKIIDLLQNKPGHQYYLIQSAIFAARQYAVLYKQTPPANKKLRHQYLTTQETFFAQAQALINPREQDGNYLVLMLGLADLECQRKNYAKAVGYINKCLPVYTRRAHTEGTIDSYNLAHQIYYAWGKQENDVQKVLKAYDFLSKASHLIATQARQSNLQKLEAAEAKYQLKQKQLSEQLMQQQMESMNNEMRLTAINLQEKITLLDELKDYVQSLNKKDFEKRQFIGAISQKIGAIKITQEDKALLQQKMDTGSAEFSKLVSEKYPALSTHEVRCCTLFKTGLSNGELAQLYGLSKRAYEQLRYRIKRKMNLPADVELVKHLAQLNAPATVG